MKRSVIIFFILSCLVFDLYAQSKTDLETQRKKTLEEITYVDNLLTNTAKEKKESINAVRILGNKVSLREKVIRGMGDEISLINSRIEINRLGIDMMEKDLITLKNDYRRAIINSYKSKKLNPEIVYILSAKDFNQGYKRLKYLQQVTRFRRNETEIITELKFQIEETKQKLEADLWRISDLKRNEEQQKGLMQSEQQRKQKMVQSLGNREKQLKKELEEKRKIARRLETEIARIMEAERKKAIKTDLTPEQKLIGESFVENKGRLPWPTERGIITGKFGVHQHPVLKYVTEDNIGIEITGSGKTTVRCIFNGVVTAITTVPGSNMTVIIGHGKYRTVYSNLVNVKVKTGENVKTKQEIGEVFMEPGPASSSIMRFMIYDQKYLDPEIWIAKN
jgi:septal ring factor EnvC (AmiA/AmiB activator)